MQLHTYLNYGGNCEEAFRFYEQHLGGHISMMMKHGEQPGGEKGPDALRGTVLHARMRLGGTDLMGSDAPAERFQPIRSAYLSLTVSSEAEAEHVYALLIEGGDIFMKLQETFYATHFAMLRDRFGTSWMLMHPKPERG